MPNNKLERFTQRARRVLSLAQEEAERLHHNYIGTEHMLLGLMREEGGVAGRVLRDLGLEYRRIEELVNELTPATARTTETTAELSPGIKRVLELSVDEARHMGHHYIGTEHLLLGLVRQSEGVAIDVIKRFGISPDEVRRQTRQALLKKPAQTNTAPTTPAEKLEHEKFTARIQRVLALAQIAANEWQHNSVGTGHLLMGMLREEDGIAGRVLRELGITPEDVEAVVKQSTQTIDSTDIIPKLSLDSQRVLQLAVDEGRRMGHHEIGIYHLLLGFTQQSEAIDILKRLGVSPEDVRQRTLRVAEKLPTSPPTPPADIAIPTGEHAKSLHFQVIENFISKMLNMVEAKSMTIEQAKELLNALQPQIELLAGESALAFSQINHLNADDKRKIILEVKAAGSDAPAQIVEMPVAQALFILDDLMVAAANHRSFTTKLAGSQLEVHVRLE